MQYIFIVLISFIFFGCSIKEDIEIKDVNNSETVIADLLSIPQDIEYYTKNISDKELYSIQKEYEKSYFSVWNIEKAPETLDSIKWPFKYFDHTESYGENLQQLKKEFFDNLYIESNYDEFSTINKKGLTLRYSNIRALPTSKPVLKDPSIAGEGFPFDYLQNSSINANVPIFISHYSKNKQWVYIFSSFANGWLKSSEIVYIDDNYTKLWQKAEQVVITEEGTSLFAESGSSLFDTRIGMIFPLIEENEDTYKILTVSSYKDSKALFNKTEISKKISKKHVLKFNKNNINNIIKQVSKTNYGWGGIYEQRDCSSTLMDMYASFGIWLPRNSSNQSKIGDIVDLSLLSDDEKIQFIKNKAVPFETFLYKTGHIVLYVGTYNDNIVVYHNTWAIKTKNGNEEGRFIIGKPVFSTLKFGKELKDYDKSAELLKNINSMNTITR